MWNLDQNACLLSSPNILDLMVCFMNIFREFFT